MGERTKATGDAGGGPSGWRVGLAAGDRSWQQPAPGCWIRLGCWHRLTASLDALGTGAVDLPERQRTLRATVEWSVVALARHSLVQLDLTSDASRCRMLETVRGFVAERLAARPDAAEVQRRHADYYRTLAEQADRPLRGDGQSEWLERLQAEARNLAAAVQWHLAHDPTPLPHLFRILWPFWFLRDRQVAGPPLGRGTATRRRLLRPRVPGRTGVGGDGNRQRGRRRPGGAGRPPTPGTAAGGDPGPPPACNRPAGHGLDFADHRRLRGRPEGGVGRPGRAPRARTSPSGLPSPHSPPAPLRPPWATPTAPCNTCA